MPKKPAVRPRGRPTIDIDWNQFKKLCALKPTLRELASYFDCSEDTIERRCEEQYGKVFAEVFKDFSSHGNLSLRRNQMKLSEKNASMAMWLGKQWLGQEDPDSRKMANSTKALADTLMRFGVFDTSKDIVKQESCQSVETTEE